MEKEKQRIYYLDICRGLAVVFMVMQHCILLFEYTSGNDSGSIGTTFALLGTAPAAPVFMLIMGLFMMKSSADNRTFITRGFKLLIAGYVLNLLRFTIPLLILGETKEALSMLLYVDIFQLAGLFFITAVVFRIAVNNVYFTPIIILFVLIVSPHLWGITPQTPVTDLLWGAGETVSFPYFPWCIYPLLGMYLSKYICFSSIVKKYRIRLLIAVVILSSLGILILDLFPNTEYERLGLGASMLVIAFILLYLLVAEWITHKYHLTPEKRLVKLLVFWSKNLTNIYLISWVIYGVITVIIGYNLYSDIFAAAIGVLVMTVTHLLTKHSKITQLIPKL